MKCCVCRMEERAWLAPTSSDSVELLVLIFFLLEKLIAAPFPRDIIAPVWLHQLLCTAWDTSTHQQIVGRLSAERFSFMWHIPRRYLRAHLSLPQLSSPGRLTQVVKKEKAV